MAGAWGPDTHTLSCGHIMRHSGGHFDMGGKEERQRDGWNKRMAKKERNREGKKRVKDKK